MTKWLLLLMLAGTCMTVYGMVARSKNPYKVSWMKRRRVKWGDHLLVYNQGWELVHLDDATEDDIEEHRYHMSQGGWRNIESNIAEVNGGGDAADDQAYYNSRVEHHRSFLTNPMHGLEDDQDRMERLEVAHAQLAGEIRRANKRGQGTERA